MLRHYYKIAWRHLIKDGPFTLLNLLGLSSGLACTILIYLWVNDEWHINRFSQGLLFQVMKNSATPSGIMTDERTPGLLSSTLVKTMPEVTCATAVIPVSWFDKKGILSLPGGTADKDQQAMAAEQFVEKDYFSMFSYRIIEGDSRHLLPDKQSIVLSREVALKLFNTTSHLVGKMVEWNQKDYSGLYRITGIVEKPTRLSVQFDIAFNYELFLEKNPKLEHWDNYDPSTYVVLRKGADVSLFNNKIAGLVKSNNKEATSTLFVQPFSETYLYNQYENGIPAGGRITYVRLFSIIAIVILTIACINFMNLSTAKAAKRIRETGIQKIIGAGKGMLIAQYLGEAVILSFLAVLAALGLVVLLLPSFNQLVGKQLSIPLTAGFILTILVITAITGVLSGSYPALYLSGFKPAVILRGSIRTAFSEVLVRKGLVVFQFTLSALFIVSVVVIYRQMHLIETKNLGYNRNNLLYFERGGRVSDNKQDYARGGVYEANLQSFLQQVKNVPGVINATNFRHNIVDRNGGTYDLSWPGKSSGTRIDFTDLAVGYDFIETTGIQLKEGRSFSRSYGNEHASIIFNEAAIEIMGLKDPIGKTVRLWGEDRVIIGVVKNFNFQSMHESLKPCFFDFTVNQWASKIMVRIQPGMESGTIARLEKLYKDYNQGEPFEYKFLDADYQALYSAERKVASLSQYFAGIAIIISCLGLFGLAAFTAQKRQREIGVRKIVGATVSHIFLLLSKDFLKLVCIALLIAFPLAWWGMDHWLGSFVYRIHLGADVFLIAGISTILLTFLSISFQAIRAGMASPVRSLRAE